MIANTLGGLDRVHVKESDKEVPLNSVWMFCCPFRPVHLAQAQGCVMLATHPSSHVGNAHCLWSWGPPAAPSLQGLCSYQLRKFDFFKERGSGCQFLTKAINKLHAKEPTFFPLITSFKFTASRKKLNLKCNYCAVINFVQMRSFQNSVSLKIHYSAHFFLMLNTVFYGHIERIWKKKKKKVWFDISGLFQELCHRFLSFSFPLGVGRRREESHFWKSTVCCPRETASVSLSLWNLPPASQPVWVNGSNNSNSFDVILPSLPESTQSCLKIARAAHVKMECEEKPPYPGVEMDRGVW